MSVPTNAGGGDDRGGLAIDRLASAAHRGQMPKLGAATATRAGLTIAGYGGDAAIGMPAATAALAGALTAADKAILDAKTATAGTATTLAYRDASGDLPAQAWASINAAGGAAPAFSTNWSNKAGYNTVQYRKGLDKRIILRGNCIKAIAVVAGETLFTLPAGFRPPAQLGFRVFSANGATPVDALIVVTTAGLVQLFGGHQDNVALTQVEFYTD